MKSILLIIISIVLSCYSLFSQSTIEHVLAEIEMNNTGLIALKKRVEADKVGNRTGINLTNPELDFNYLFGNTAELGNRTDISLKQSFDFPSAYAYKARIANSRNLQSDLQYQSQRKDLLYQVRLLCVDLIYTNAVKKEYDKRLTHAKSITSSYKLKLDKGEAGILEFNKAQLNQLNVSKEVESNEINRIALLSELVALNGGLVVFLNDTLLLTNVIANDFEKWYLQAEQSNPALSWLKQEIEIMMMQEKLNLALSLPKFSAGYMSEKVIGQEFRGISAGLSIPLWENKNSVKYAKARAVAVQNKETDSKLLFYHFLKSRHEKATALQKSVIDYRISLKLFDNSVLLKKALDTGEISLTDYFYEISLFYESVNKLLEAERDLNKTVSALNQYTD